MNILFLSIDRQSCSRLPFFFWPSHNATDAANNQIFERLLIRRGIDIWRVSDIEKCYIVALFVLVQIS